ncbi:Eukaryotic translation initiation factor 3 subunit H [Smittium culicis]|uniref:Eukaryotic translation initiation factor 3 subunit H n=1 Tax=Smittium culicis TaxID=133412 RepID=A0A1R1Y353_9FUNG|nr:Eukaryotic translation initiation factor 3 subunit H [Smittium culicis]
MDFSSKNTLANLLVKEADAEIDTTVPEHLEGIDSEPIVAKHVVVDPTVAFKIIKHAREHFPRSVNGQILGLEIKGTVEVTNSFPFPTNNSSDEDLSYRSEMQNYMQEVNMESNPIGWYLSTRTSNFLQKATLDAMNSHQEELSSKAILLVYDAERSEQGSLSLRAFQLSDSYLALHKNNSFTTPDLVSSKLQFNNIYEELPVRINSMSLSKVLLNELEIGNTLLASNKKDDKVSSIISDTYEHHIFNNSLLRLNPALKTRLEIEADANVNSDALEAEDFITDYFKPSSNTLNYQNLSNLEKSMELMIDCIDDYTQDANSWMYWQRGAAKENGRRQAYVQRKIQENTVRESNNQQPIKIESESELDSMFRLQPEPSRIDALLNMSHIHGITRQINQTCGPAVTRLYSSLALQNDLQK